MSFDTYLQDNGFQSGTRLSPEQARALYGAYQYGGGLSAGTIVGQSLQERRNQPQQGGGMNMGSMMGIGKSFMGGGEGATGSSGGSMGGSYAGAVGGALSGWMAGQANYDRDPRMRDKKDGFGTHYPDYRSRVGGATLGGVMGYYGLGEAAGPAVTVAHEVMEPTTRWLINTGDQIGGAGGAMMLDPAGTISSGKYDAKELIIGGLMGPAADWFGII